MTQTIFWIGFNFLVLILLALDLGVFHKKSHAIKVKEAALWSGFWISLALLFALFIFLWRGPQSAQEFLTGYLIEKSLSVDNIFIFLTIFSFFKVPPRFQHKILYWGVLGALVMRGLFIFLGIQMIQKAHWTVYVLGAFLILTGIRMAFGGDREIDPEASWVLRGARKILPVASPSLISEADAGKFLVRKGGRLLFTPLFIVLIFIETTDVIFAVDSIPAVLAITSDAFIVYTSNVFAILGLRSLYFALAGAAEMFHQLHYGLAAILVFVGGKMVASDVIHIPTPIALSVIFGILVISVVVSVLSGGSGSKIDQSTNRQKGRGHE